MQAGTLTAGHDVLSAGRDINLGPSAAQLGRLRGGTRYADLQADLWADEAFRRECAARLKETRWGTLYQENLEWAVALADRFFGPPLSQRAFGACFVLALIYAYLGFWLAYGLGAPGTLASTELAPRSDGMEQAFLGLGIIVASLIAWWIGYRGGRLERWRRKRRLRIRRQRSGKPIKPNLGAADRVRDGLFVGGTIGVVMIVLGMFGIHVRVVVGLGLYFSIPALLLLATAIVLRIRPQWRGGVAALLVGAGVVAVVIAEAVAGVVAGVVAVAVAGAVAVAVAVAVVVAVAVAVAGIEAGAGAVALPVAVVAGVGAAQGLWRIRGQIAWLAGAGAPLSLGLMLLMLGADDSPFILILIAFFLVIPLLNAFLDVVSWLWSRWMAGHLRGELRRGSRVEGRVVSVLWHTLGDLALAVLSLALLAWLLAFAFEFYGQAGWAGLIGAEHGSYVRPMIDEAMDGPWQDGFWIMLMLFSTLVPTVIHMAFLVFAPLAVVALPGQRRRELVARLEGFDLAGEAEQTTTVRKVASYFARERRMVWAVAAASVVLGPIGLLYATLHLSDWQPLDRAADLLYAVALNGISWAHWLVGPAGP